MVGSSVVLSPVHVLLVISYTDLIRLRFKSDSDTKLQGECYILSIAPHHEAHEFAPFSGMPRLNRNSAHVSRSLHSNIPPSSFDLMVFASIDGYLE